MSLIFSGSANPQLAASVALYLGREPAARQVRRFPDGELYLRLDELVCNQDVFVIQPTSPPADARLFELLAFADACRRSRARTITAVIPYFGYARSDKRHSHQEPILAAMGARLVETAGFHRVISLDFHSAQIEGFFHIPVDHLTAVPVLCEVLRDRLPSSVTVVSPDEGRVKMAAHYARLLGAPVAVLHKERASGTDTRVMRVVGEVADRVCLIIDDMISTGGTIARTVDALLEADAKPEIYVAATHGLFVGDARDKLSHKAIRAIFATDTVRLESNDWKQLEVVSVAPLIASAIEKPHSRAPQDDHNIQESDRRRAPVGGKAR
jgi:ribose-phosphate pyrophosphokinase